LNFKVGAMKNHLKIQIRLWPTSRCPGACLSAASHGCCTCFVATGPECHASASVLTRSTAICRRPRAPALIPCEASTRRQCLFALLLNSPRLAAALLCSVATTPHVPWSCEALSMQPSRCRIHREHLIANSHL
jgi:hypothetical protein